MSGILINEYMNKRYKEVTPIEFYRGIFNEGELDKKDAYTKGKYTGIFVAVSKEKKDGKAGVRRYTITDDLDAIREAEKSTDFCICSPISYAGKSRSSDNARYLYAITIDLDRIDMSLHEGEPIGIANLMHQIQIKYLPKPTYIVSSGSGLHLYYCLDEPIPLFDNIAKDIQEFKKELTKLIWNDNVVKIKDQAEIQQEGIYQGYRMPGTITKFGTRAKAYITGDKVTIDYLEGFVAKAAPQAKKKQDKLKKLKLTLEEAKAAYPEWYERRIEKKEPKGVWHTSRRVYEWWKRQIESGAVEGHRYYCLMILAMYGKKCSFYDEKHNPNPVTLEEVEQDCLDMVDMLDSRSIVDRFTRDDALKALEAYNEKWVTYPIKMIEFRSGIRIEKNKRNGQKQSDHLEEARAIQQIRCRRSGVDWREGNGRKSLENKVYEWRINHIFGSKADCIRDTGLSKATVYKYWDIPYTDETIDKIDKSAKLNIERCREIEEKLLCLAIAEFPELEVTSVTIKHRTISISIKAHLYAVEKRNEYTLDRKFSTQVFLHDIFDSNSLTLKCTEERIISSIKTAIAQIKTDYINIWNDYNLDVSWTLDPNECKVITDGIIENVDMEECYAMLHEKVNDEDITSLIKVDAEQWKYTKNAKNNCRENDLN